MPCVRSLPRSCAARRYVGDDEMPRTGRGGGVEDGVEKGVEKWLAPSNFGAHHMQVLEI